VDFQPLFDKIAAKLPGWYGKNIARPGRIALAKTVLMATVTYHATVIQLSQWARKQITRIVRNFIWAGDEGEHAARGKALVNWKTVCRPKHMGGLGMPDLERSGRALRLRWPWLQWTDPDRVWTGSKLPCNSADMNLFRASTKITIGNGEKASFWRDNWCDQGPLRDWAPDLYRIATRKKRTVATELYNNNWIRSVAKLNTPIQLAQYLQVWDLVQSTQISPQQPDSIRWTLTADGNYSASSAYLAQFNGSFPKFKAEKIWDAHAEPKCKLFSWLALHGKLLTADMLAVRGWPHDPTCLLCGSAPETAAHLCKDCPYSMAVWTTLQSRDNEATGTPGHSFATISEWWDDMTNGKTKKERCRFSGRLLYALWNVWKERNRRVFTGQRLTYLEVASIARDDIRQRGNAFTSYGPAIPAEPD
jgi:hypothetical protein